MEETHGYEDLTAYARSKNQPIFVESYQLVSMLRWYGLEKTYQWPHLTRPSYYVFNQDQMAQAYDAYKNSSKFLLIYPQMITYEIEGFQGKELVKLIDCKEGFYVISSSDLSSHPSCKPIHIWYGLSLTPSVSP